MHSELRTLAVMSWSGIYTDNDREALQFRFEVMRSIVRRLYMKWNLPRHIDRILGTEDNVLTP